MSENIFKPLTVEPGPVVLRNCWTCGWDQRVAWPGRERHMCNSDSSAAEGWQARTEFGDNDMPPKTADGCPPWKPKPEQASTDRELEWVKDPRSGNAHAGLRCMACAEMVTMEETRALDAVARVGICGCGPFPAEQIDRMLEQPPDPPPPVEPEDVDDYVEAAWREKSADTITVQRAEWDATLARIDELERRVGKNSRDLARQRRTR